MHGWTNLLSTGVGALAAWGGIGITHWLKEQRKRRNVAGSLAAELSGLVRIVEQKRLRDLLETCENNGIPPKIPIAENPIPIFDAQAKNLGLLPLKLTHQVVTTYISVRSIVEDLGTLKYFFEKSPDLGPDDVEQIKRVARGARELYDEVLSSTKDLVPRLEEESRRGFPDE
jgi:hypothetical protein